MKFSRSIKQVPATGEIPEACSLIAQAGILVAAAISILLCGGRSQGSLGVFLGVAAVMLVCLPPRSSQPVAVWVMAAVVIMAGAMALLPAGLLEMPAWWQELLSEKSFGTLDRITVVPAETAFWLAILASTLIVAIYLLSQPVGPAGMLGLAAGASLFCAGYAGLAVFAETTGWRSEMDAGPSFGFFANRNHVATLLITGSLTGLGVITTGITKKYYFAMLCGAVGVTTCAWTIFLVSPSRAGVLLLVAGVGIWLLGLGRRRITRPMAVVFLTLSAVALVFFLGIDNPAARRMIGEWGASPVGGIASDYRFKVYQDALRLWSDFPLTGAGLGSYRFLYPFYADASLTEVTTIHPESDWLLLGLEAGPLALAGMMSLLAMVSWRFVKARESEGWSVRWALVSSAIVAVVHGVFDVPLHRIELGWWVMVLLCLGLGRPSGAWKVRQNSRWQRLAFVVFGVLMGGLSWQLVSAEWLGGGSLAPYEAKEAAKGILAKHAAGHIEEALDLAIEACGRHPMEKDLHYQRGVLALHFEDMDSEVDSAFKAAKMLSPNWPLLPREMGQAWYQVDRSKAATLWLEAVERQSKIDQIVNQGGPPGAKLYGDILARAGRDPEVIQSLRPPPELAPALHFSWIRATSDAAGHIRALAENAGFLAALTEDEKTEFLVLWRARGDRNFLKEFISMHPAWEKATWAVHVQELISEKNYREAVDILATRYSVSLKLPAASGPDQASLEKEYVELIAARNHVAARRVLKEAVQGGGQRRSVAHRLAAASAADAGDWATAYKELIAHLKASGQKLPSNL